MLDTHGRRFVQPLIEKLARMMMNLGLTANRVTVIAFLIGLMSPLLIYLGHPIVGVVVLWISGLLDAVDGTIARIGNQKSNRGALMDITFDRLVEVSLIFAFGLIHSGSSYVLMLLLGAIIFSMTVFLTVGSLAQNTTKKAFLYQAGVAERTEGFVFFSLMALFPKLFPIITLIFAGLILFTGCQRFYQGIRLLDDK